MKFALVSQSSNPGITPAVLEQIAGAVERQLYEHWAPFWEAVGAPVKVYTAVKDVPIDESLVIIFDKAEQPGFLGYHDVTPDGRSYARIFLEPILASGGSIMSDPNSLSVTISHEILEIIGDPYASFWGSNNDDNNFYAYEMCDAVEAQAYIIDGVYVSNFIGPRFFRTGPGPYDWLRLITAPFQTGVDGYQIRGPDLNHIGEIFGENYPKWKKDLKASKRKHGRKAMRRIAV